MMSQYGSEMVGKRVSVYWDQDDESYKGVISEFVEGKHKVCYDDGEVECVDLSQQQVV